MSVPLFLVAFVVGAALLALWFDVRFPGLAPTRIRDRFAAAAVALLILSLPLHAGAVALLALYLPLIAFAFLTMLWLLRLLAERRTF
ncbi:MAG TPA: hypothetical protein VFI37_01685 [Gaiellaceae bacterium]|nr:hypothetical protein [Gaiellaceae bacterium]